MVVAGHDVMTSLSRRGRIHTALQPRPGQREQRLRGRHGQQQDQGPRLQLGVPAPPLLRASVRTGSDRWGTVRGGHVVKSLLARSLYGTVPGHLGLSQLADKDRGGDDAGRSADWLLQPPGDGGAHRRVPDTPGVSPHPQLGPDSSLLAGAVRGARHWGRRLGLRSVRKFTQENVRRKY